MRTLLAGAALLAGLVGCTPDTPEVECPNLPIFKNVRSEYAGIDCDRLASDILIARKIIVDRGIISDEDFELVFENVPITIRDADALNKPDASYGEDVLLGTYGPADGITLTRSTSALVHEMLHHVDWVEFLMGPTLVHAYWKERGFYDADAEYNLQYRSPAPYHHNSASATQ